MGSCYLGTYWGPKHGLDCLGSQREAIPQVIQRERSSLAAGRAGWRQEVADRQLAGDEPPHARAPDCGQQTGALGGGARAADSQDERNRRNAARDTEAGWEFGAAVAVGVHSRRLLEALRGRPLSVVARAWAASL